MSPKEQLAPPPAPPPAPPAGAIPGLVKMTMADYRKHPALGRSDSDELRYSPAHFRYASEHGRPDSLPKLKGRVFHTLILERHLLAETVAVYDGATRQGKGWEACVAANPDKDIIRASELADLVEVEKAFRARFATARLLDDALIEHAAFATLRGVAVKARPDIVRRTATGGLVIYDLKSTDDASPKGFQRSAFSLGYHRQAAWYRDVVEAATGLTVEGFYFVAVELSAPYEANILRADPAFIACGAVENAELLAVYKHCSETGVWPGYTAGAPTTLELPRWV